MRVLIATPWFPSAAHTGAGVFNLRDAQLLARDHEVRVLHLIRPDWYDASERGEVSGVAVERVPFSASAPRSWRGARNALAAGLRDAELLHTMAFPALLPLTGMRVEQPWVHTEHWSGLAKPVTGAKAPIKRALHRRLRRPDEVVAVSAALAASIRPWTRRDPRVIGNAVPLPPEGAVSRPAEPGRPLRIVSVGGIAPHKGPLIAAETVAELVSRGHDVELRWIGSGPQRAELEQRAAALGLGERILLRGQLERSELEAELLAANAFLLPTAGETFGVAFAEALACGLPVVASGTGGHVSMLSDFEATRIAERSAAPLADALIDLLRGDDEARRIATAAAARERFSEEARLAAYAEVYRAARTAH